MAGMAAVFALLTGIRYAPRSDPFVNQPGANAAVLMVRSANDIVAIIPIFLLLLALQSITPTEFSATLGIIVLALVVSALIAAFRGPTMLVVVGILTMVAMHRRSGFESILILIYATHLLFKARVAFAMANAMRSPNVTFEMIAPLNANELAGLRRKSFRVARGALLALAFLNMAILVTAGFWPLKMEEKLPLALVLGFGIVSLFLDTFALAWLAMLKRKPLVSLAIILGIPWAVAWAFAALRTGEAFTMNEGAAYFFLWAALGSTLSWLVGSAAKQKLQRDFREIAASPSLYPSGKAP
jgi:hypothetical protein